jgi:hypothetical protein
LFVDNKDEEEQVMEERGPGLRTTVILSTLSMNGSEVRYRESERAYSFQSWAKRFCDDATVA